MGETHVLFHFRSFCFALRIFISYTHVLTNAVVVHNIKVRKQGAPTTKENYHQMPNAKHIYVFTRAAYIPEAV
jgi:hypothetical protein